MDTNYLSVNFVDFCGLPDDLAKELFEVLYPEHKYNKAEFPWRLSSRVIIPSDSPKKLPSTSTNQVNNGSPLVAQPPDHRAPFPENTITKPSPQQHASPIVSAPLIMESHMPPAPFQSTGVSSQRPLPHNNISQFTQPARMAFYGRPHPFPVVSTNYSMPHGQEIMTMHQGYPSDYELGQPNEPPPGMDHMHHMQQAHKYRSDKPYMQHRKVKKNYYDNSYAQEELCMGMVEADSLSAQQMGQPIVQYSPNHFTGGISTAGAYTTVGPYIHPSGYLSYMPYPSYIQQTGHLGPMMELTSPEVMPYEPPNMVVPPPPPPATVPRVIPREQMVVCQPPSSAPPVSMLPEQPEVVGPADIVEPLLQAEHVQSEEVHDFYESDKEKEPEQLRPDSPTIYESPMRTPEPTPSVETETETELQLPVQEESVPKSEAVSLTPASITSSGVTSAWGKPKSWAGVFGTTGSPTSEALSNQVKDPVVPSFEEEDDVATNDGESDFLVHKLGKFVQRYQLDYVTRPVQPRGLINRSNWCYINATLQALLACPALFNMLKQLQEIVCHRPKSCTPITDSLVELVSEFVPTGCVSKRKEDLVIGPPLEPVCIYKMLSLIKSECIKGRQEDAEEFLSCILNGLHEEIVALSKASLLNNGTCNGGIQTNGRLEGSDGDDEEEEERREQEEEENHWKVMGAKNKGMVTRSDQASVGSLVKDLFGGQTRSVLTAAGSECSAVLQPFFTLQLDIQLEGESVCDSLSHQLSVKEAIQGYQCPKSKREVEAHRRTTLEEIPPVLILHYKRFVYDDKDGGSKKVLKRTEYSLDLEIKKDFLSLEVKSKYGAKPSRSYKLFAVVYHDGKEAVKGHYIADIYYPGCGIWLRCDDRNVAPVTEAQVQSFNPPCVPYLLFYERTDVQLATK